MSNDLSKTFTFPTLLKFVIPSVIMTVITNSYTLIDGLFISRYAGANALAAVNLITPMFAMVCSTAIMFATGGSATVSKLLGEKRDQEAKEHFTAMVILSLALIASLLVIASVCKAPLLGFMGADATLFADAEAYFSRFLPFFPAVMLHILLQIFFMAAGKPHISLKLTLLGGAINISCDYLFIAHLNMGTGGAATASGLGYAIPGLVGASIFTLNSRLSLTFTKPVFIAARIGKSLSNGLSEMINYVAMAITTLGFNLFLMKQAGPSGVAAITAMLYTQMFMNSVYVGYVTAIAPIAGFKLGAKDEEQLHFLFKSSLCIIASASALVFLTATRKSDLIMGLFFSSTSDVFLLASQGFSIFALAYLASGINIFASGYLTALSKGRASALISLMRTFVFVVFSLIFLPKIFGLKGVWLSIPLAETLALLVSAGLLFKHRKFCFQNRARLTPSPTTH